jgi:hypothetical protein
MVLVVAKREKMVEIGREKAKARGEYCSLF